MVIDDEGDDPYMPIREDDRPPSRRRPPRVLNEIDKVRIRAVYNQVANRHLDDICQFLAERYGLDVTAELVMEVMGETASGGPAVVTFESTSDRRRPGR